MATGPEAGRLTCVNVQSLAADEMRRMHATDLENSPVRCIESSMDWKASCRSSLHVLRILQEINADTDRESAREALALAGNERHGKVELDPERVEAVHESDAGRNARHGHHLGHVVHKRAVWG